MINRIAQLALRKKSPTLSTVGLGVIYYSYFFIYLPRTATNHHLCIVLDKKALNKTISLVIRN
jgi:hypothetical protein